MGLLLAPVFLVLFWYHDFLLGSIKTSYYLFIYIVNLLSAPLLIRTFFKPLKSEYREGLVLFSILMGIFVKSVILFVSAIVLLISLVILVGMNIGIILFPAFLIWLLIT